MNTESTNIFIRHQHTFFPVVTFNPAKDRLAKFDFSAGNKTLTASIVESTDQFSAYVNSLLKASRSKFGIGGYAEYRSVYSRSNVFDGAHATEEPRRLHLGTDIWGPVGAPVFAPLGGMVHSFAFNDQYGDYGATIILLHQLDGVAFYTLYGHLSLGDLAQLNEGAYIIRGQEIAHFGKPAENGHWPPHLHFQIIFDTGVHKGDYPGVCKYSEREKYLQNCPDPDLILQLNRYAE